MFSSNLSNYPGWLTPKVTRICLLSTLINFPDSPFACKDWINRGESLNLTLTIEYARTLSPSPKLQPQKCKPLYFKVIHSMTFIWYIIYIHTTLWKSNKQSPVVYWLGILCESQTFSSKINLSLCFRVVKWRFFPLSRWNEHRCK